MIPTSPFYQALLGGAAFCVVLAVAGGVLTNLSPWYYTLRQPPWKPPDWAFGAIWTVVFICYTIAIAYAWAASTAPLRSTILWAIAINGVLNVAWSAIFFTLKKPGLALAEVVIFWFSILALIYILGGVSQIALLLLLPYILWVTIASILNFEIVRLNRT
jgi:translocator protein